MPTKISYKKLRYFVGNFIRIVTVPLFQHKIDIENMSTIFGCSLSDNGWHHIVKTLEEYDKNPYIKVEETTMWLYLKNFTPYNINSCIKKKLNNKLKLFQYPWGWINTNAINKDPYESRFCGPSNEEFIQKEFYNTIKLYDIIKKQGYKPLTFPNNFVSGTLLIKKNREKKFIVLQGNHRVAILAHLGLKKIDVRTLKGVRKVNEKDLKKWPNVINGLCSEKEAKEIFDYFFYNKGLNILEIIKN